MGRPNSLADVLTDWEELLEAVRRSPDLLPDVEEDIALLEGLLAQARALKARQNELAALRQEVTQRLNAEMGRGKETAIGMRSTIRGKIGPRNERLVQFGIAPLRKRRRPVRSRPPEKPQGDDGSGNDPQQTPDAGVEARAGVVAVEVDAGDVELAPGAVGHQAVEVVAGTDAAAGAEPLRGGVGADAGGIRAGDVRPLQPGVTLGLEDVRLGVAGRMDHAEAEVLAGVGLEDRRLGIAADPTVVEDLVELRELAGAEERQLAVERRLRPPARAVPERLGAVVDRLLAAVLGVVVDRQVGHRLASRVPQVDVVLDDEGEFMERLEAAVARADGGRGAGGLQAGILIERPGGGGRLDDQRAQPHPRSLSTAWRGRAQRAKSGSAGAAAAS